MRLPRLAALGCALAVSDPASAQSAYDYACPSGPQLASSQLTNEVARAIFQVVVADAHGESRANGTATLVDSRGYYLTAGHVVDQYAKEPSSTVTLRRFDGKTLIGTVVANFIDDGLDLAIIKTPERLLNVRPVALRISSPFGSGTVSSGKVLAYRNDQTNISLPVDFSIGGSAGDVSSMTLGFAAVGGNSGALLLEPSGRAFGVLRDGPDQAAMQIPLYVPATLIPSRNGKFALPEIAIPMWPEDVQAAVKAALQSKAVTISSFWDRLAAVIPPSQGVDAAVQEIRARGWRDALPDILSSGDNALTSIDIVHLYRKVGADDALIKSALGSIADVMNLMAQTCSADAFSFFVTRKVASSIARMAAADKDTGAAGATRRASASALLSATVRVLSKGSARTAGEIAHLRDAVSDLAIVEFNRMKFGEASQGRVAAMVSIAEGLGGTPTSAEVAGLIASRNGDAATGSAFLVLADARLRDVGLNSNLIDERRGAIARIYQKMGGLGYLGAPVSLVPQENAQAIITNRAQISDVAKSLRPHSAVSAVEAAGMIDKF